MKSILIAFLIASLAIVISCNKSSRESTTTKDNLSVAAKNSVDGGLTIPLNSCRTQIFTTDSVTVCFDEVISDSRCPRKVQCVWAGMATIQLTILINGQSNVVELSTMAPNNTVTISGYQFDFIDLIPYPVYNVTPSPADIKAIILITKV